MSETKIEWADRTWNPITGCTPISEGCQNCYAKRMATRLQGRCGYPKDKPFQVTIHRDRFEEPLHWKPSRIFVCSMGDLFHDDVSFTVIDRVFEMINLCSKHTFMILTKRPARMLRYFSQLTALRGYVVSGSGTLLGTIIGNTDRWPLPNLWLGVTTENQVRVDERIPILLQIPAVVRFVSVEPMLGPVILTNIDAESAGHKDMYFINSLTGKHDDMGRPCNQLNKLNWVICGGETGPGARPMHPDWVRSLRDQCQAAVVPFFFKSWGDWLPNAQEYGANPGNFNYEKRHVMVGDVAMCRAGKKYSGRLLDGQEWSQYPGVTP